MATIESLPADQRAVLQLVLQRGRTYDEIARLLSIDRAGVRARRHGRPAPGGSAELTSQAGQPSDSR
jgi:hypothetical protein